MFALPRVSHSISFHISPRRASSRSEMLPGELRIAFGHLYIRVAQNFGKFVKITTVHHEPGSKCVTQIMESEALDASPLKQVLKTSFYALSSTRGARFRRKNSVFTDDSGKPPQLAGEFR